MTISPKAILLKKTRTSSCIISSSSSSSSSSSIIKSSLLLSWFANLFPLTAFSLAFAALSKHRALNLFLSDNLGESGHEGAVIWWPQSESVDLRELENIRVGVLNVRVLYWDLRRCACVAAKGVEGHWYGGLAEYIANLQWWFRVSDNSDTNRVVSQVTDRETGRDPAIKIVCVPWTRTQCNTDSDRFD